MKSARIACERGAQVWNLDLRLHQFPIASSSSELITSLGMFAHRLLRQRLVRLAEWPSGGWL